MTNGTPLHPNADHALLSMLEQASNSMLIMDAEFRVRRSDLDRVGHANNVRFVEWALEALPDGAGLTEIDILYRSEAVVGDRVRSEAGPLVGGARAHRLSRESDGRFLALARTVWSP